MRKIITPSEGICTQELRIVFVFKMPFLKEMSNYETFCNYVNILYVVRVLLVSGQ